MSTQITTHSAQTTLSENSSPSDRMAAFSFERANGTQLTVGIICDGGYNRQHSRTIADMALKAITEYLQSGSEEHTPHLLSAAILAANEVLIDSKLLENKTAENGPSLAVGAIENGSQLYIAHVGVCRFYLQKKQSLYQLNVQHTFKHIRPSQGQISVDKADNHPRSHEQVSALGISPTLAVDIGFHLYDQPSVSNYKKAQLRGVKGIPISGGDSLLITSDRLIKKKSSNHFNLIDTDELNELLVQHKPEAAIDRILNKAASRGLEDGASLVMLHKPRPFPIYRPTKNKTLGLYQFQISQAWGMAGLALALALFLVLFGIRRSFQTAVEARVESTSVVLADVPQLESEPPRTRTNETLAKQNQANHTALPSATAVHSQTPTPTHTTLPTATPQPSTTTIPAVATSSVIPNPTAVPTITTVIPKSTPHFLGIYREGNAPLFNDLIDGKQVELERNAEFRVNSTATKEDLLDPEEAGANFLEANLYALFGSSFSVQEDQKENRRLTIQLQPESDIFIETGPYAAGAVIQLEVNGSALQVVGRNGCFSTVFSPQKNILTAYCFAGSCQYQVDAADLVDIPTGQRISFRPLKSEQLTSHSEPIPPAIAESYQQLLLNFYSGIEVIDQCFN